MAATKKSAARRALPASFADDRRWDTYVDRAKANKKALRVISEGDSWFDFVTSGRALDGCVVDLAVESPVFLDLATSGHTAEKMFGTSRGSEVLRLVLRRANKAKVPPHLMLVSGGGNDVLANRLNQILWSQIGPDQDAKHWINEAQLRVVLTDILGHLETLLALRDADAPNCHVVFHTYSYLERMGKEGLLGRGPWVGNKMSARGLDDIPTQKAVVELLLDAFFEHVLTPLTERRNVAVIDLREKLRPFKPADAWYDEIHPTSAGYQKLAQAYLPTLRELFPGRF